MLSEDELRLWLERSGLPEPTRALIRRVRSSEPSRHVGSWRGNVSGRYPSKKMGVTIQFESHRVELAAIYEMEHDREVLSTTTNHLPSGLNTRVQREDIWRYYIRPIILSFAVPPRDGKNVRQTKNSANWRRRVRTATSRRTGAGAAHRGRSMPPHWASTMGFDLQGTSTGFFKGTCSFLKITSPWTRNHPLPSPKESRLTWGQPRAFLCRNYCRRPRASVLPMMSIGLSPATGSVLICGQYPWPSLTGFRSSPTLR